LLPDPGAALPRLSYYFRDFTVTFYPLRLLQARELAQGRWPSWNPYIQEGTFVLPALYPFDLLHAFWPGPAAVSWLLTLQFPLAALAFHALARSLGAGRVGASLSGCVYALGGLALSSLNLYVFLQALAVLPLVVLGFHKAAGLGGRWIPLAGLVLCVALTTLAFEFVAQGLLLGIGLGLVTCPRVRGALRMGLALALGTGLAAPTVCVILGILKESVRGAGFPTSVALANEVHPVALLQVMVPGLFGSLSSPVEGFWGGAFFTKGFPYFLSLYLGPLVVALAGLGFLGLDRRKRWVLAAGGGLGLWYSLGARGGLASLVASWSVARWFRFPSKAFLLPYLVAALLAGLGLGHLRGDAGETKRAWRRFGLLAGLAAAITLVPAIALLAGGGRAATWLGLKAEVLSLVRRSVLTQSLFEATVALAGIGLSWAAVTRRVRPSGAANLLALLVGADLANAALGMNPQTAPRFFEPLPELASLRLADLGGGRVFTYGLDFSPAFRGFLARPQPGLGLWSFFLNRQVLAPYGNILDGVELAEAKDVTAFVPRPLELLPEDYDPKAVGRILERLRNAAVSRVISMDPLEHPDLRLLATVPAGPPELFIRVYTLEKPWPRAYVACRAMRATGAQDALEAPLRPGFEAAADVALEEPGEADCSKGEARRLGVRPGEEHYAADLDGHGYLVTRDSHARAWVATVDGAPERVLRANGKHRAVPLGPGHHEVVLRYRPPGLRLGLTLAAAAAAIMLMLGLRPVFLEPVPASSIDPPSLSLPHIRGEGSA
jgi:hypothetical protein